MILEPHRHHLAASGLSDETVVAAGLHTVADPAEAARLLNWKGESGPAPAIAFPVFGFDGSVEQTVLRPDSPRMREDGSVAKYEQPVGEHHRVWFPPSGLVSHERLADPAHPLIFVEGIKKALAAIETGGIALSMQGVSVWHDAEHRATNKGRPDEWQLHPDLEPLRLNGRLVYVAFDGCDTTENPPVILAEARLARMLLGTGANPLLIRIPFSRGKVGLDDYLAQLPRGDRAAALEALFAKAVSGAPLNRVAALPKGIEKSAAALTLLRDPSFAAALRVADLAERDLVGEGLRKAGLTRKAVQEAVRRFNSSLRVAPEPARRDASPESGRTTAKARASLSRTCSTTTTSESPRSDEDELPTIRLGTREAEIVDQAEREVAAAGAAYQRAGLLVRVRRDLGAPKYLRRAPQAPQIAPYSVPNCRELLSRVANWEAFDKRSESWERKRPPNWLAEDLLARGEWAEIRPLVGLLESPTLRADGTVLSTPGYDRATGLLLEPSGPVGEIPEHPTREAALAARDALLEVVQDFPFAKKAHQSAWLATVLTFFARYAITGRVPLTLFEAPAAGTGKTLLADAIGMICTGRELPKMANTVDDAEMRKRLLAIGTAGDAFVLLDNVRGGLGTPSLDMALTAGVIKERVLGLNEDRTVPMNVIFLASGNNVELLGDTRRRVLHCRIESNQERPEERGDFVHPNLLAWVKAERPRLAAAALTVLRAYHLAGRPSGAVRSWGSFEPWQHLVCGAVRWLELAAPEDTRAGLVEAESGPEVLGTLLRAWRNCQPDTGMSAAMAIRRMSVVGGEELADAVANAAPAKVGGTPDAKRLGYYLRSVKGRVLGGLRLDGGLVEGTRRWWVSGVDGVDGAHRPDLREKVAVPSLGMLVDSSEDTRWECQPSAPSTLDGAAHRCACGRRFPCPGAACLCPNCGMPPVGGHRTTADTFPMNGAVQ